MARTSLSFLAGVVGLLLLMEVLFRVLPVSSATMAGYHIDPRLYGYAPNIAVRYAFGWDLRNPQLLKTNSHGFVSDHEFNANPAAIALIGDSYVEAAALASTDRPGAQLERAMGSVGPVYAMGSPGSSLLDYAERIRWAHQNFGIRNMVVLLEPSDAQQSLCGSANVKAICLDPASLSTREVVVASATGIKLALRHSALAQYLVSQLKLDPMRLLEQTFSRSIPHVPAPQGLEPQAKAFAAASPSPQSMAEIDAVVATFFERVKPLQLEQLILVVDADRRATGRAADIEDPRRRRLIDLARAAGATVVDTELIYRRHFSSSTLSLEIGPYDGHLNALAVRLMTAEVARELALH